MPVKKRNYKKEYANYQGTEEQKRNVPSVTLPDVKLQKQARLEKVMAKT